MSDQGKSGRLSRWFRPIRGCLLKSSVAPVSWVCLLVGFVGVMSGQAPSANEARRGLPASAVLASPKGLSAASPAGVTESNFVIGNDDVLGINVWKETDVSRSVQVRSDGKISLPLMGEIQAAGLTPKQLEQDITARLQQYIAKPIVTVIVEQVNSKKYNILGQVARPGTYSLAQMSTVMDAIAAAGGLRDFAKQKDIYILRQIPNGGKSRIAFNYKGFITGKNLDQNIQLEPHDTIVVP